MGVPRKAHALAALFAGAAAIGTSALFVKVSETGPVATAFWRVALALPVLCAWAWSTDRRAGTARRAATPGTRRMMLWAGAFFAGDLAVWHWSIILTSVATATLLANLAPLFVTLAAWLLFRNPPGMRFAGALAVALAGMMLLVQGDFRAGGQAWVGDVLGVITAMFYAAYQITVNRVRAQASTARIMAWSSAVTAVLLAPVVWLSGEVWLPATAAGWLKLIGLALIAQAAGQSLIAYALAHLSAVFASVGLLVQPVVAGVLAWLLLGETLSASQLAGAALVLAGIAAARHADQARARNGQG